MMVGSLELIYKTDSSFVVVFEFDVDFSGQANKLDCALHRRALGSELNKEAVYCVDRYP